MARQLSDTGIADGRASREDLEQNRPRQRDDEKPSHPVRLAPAVVERRASSASRPEDNGDEQEARPNTDNQTHQGTSEHLCNRILPVNDVWWCRALSGPVLP